MLFKKKEEKDYQIDMNNIPAHIAFIMDGNGRWAKKEKCHEHMVIMKVRKQSVHLLWRLIV